MTEAFRIPSLAVSKTGSMVVPHGPEVDRPSIGQEGEIRGNVTTGMAEIYLNGNWASFGGGGLKMGNTIDANKTTELNQIFPVNTHNGMVTITLPDNAGVGDFVEYFDVSDKWDEFPVKFTSVININGDSGDMEVPVKGGHIRFHCMGASLGWVQTSFSVRGTSAGGDSVANWKVLDTVGPHALTANTGYILNATGLTGPIQVTLPTVNLKTDDVVAFWDISFELDKFGIQVTPTQGEIDQKQNSQTWFQNGLVKTLRARVANNEPFRWYTMNDSAAGSAGVWTTQQAGPIVMVQRNTSYMTDTRTAQADVFFPDNPQTGDSFWLHDIHANAGEHNLKLHPGTAGRIDGQTGNQYIKKDGWSGLFVYSGIADKGWQTVAGKSVSANDDVVELPQAAIQSFDFKGNIKTYRVAVSATTELKNFTFPANTVTSFFIILEMDAVGGHAVTVPGTQESWYAGVGSQTISGDANVVNVIQGIHVDGRTLYNNSRYIIS